MDDPARSIAAIQIGTCIVFRFKLLDSPILVFSHQRLDTAYAERIACLAKHHRLHYWLDVHDPHLAQANSLPESDPRRSILIAAVIEIALLNSTHITVIHTSNSQQSKWTPYELGRAKAHRILSDQAAGWFEPQCSSSNFGDYVQLIKMFFGGERDLIHWLGLISLAASADPAAACLGQGFQALP